MNAEFTHHANTHLTSLTTEMITSSTVQCTAMCLMTDGCLAVGVTITDDVISCSLATNFRVTYDVTREAGSDVFVRNISSGGGN